MIDWQIFSWVLWLAMILLSSFACVRFARRLPFSEAAKNVNAPLFFGLAFAPFLLGFLTIITLKIFPENSHKTHLIFILVDLIIAVYSLSLWERVRVREYQIIMTKNISQYMLQHPHPSLSQRERGKKAWYEKTALILLAAFSIFLLYSSVVHPLMQADALEYAQMGRIIYDTRTLASYPPLNPENHPSGFYSPVTHPPLYVALIYLSYLLQGSADAPILMRLISPWCALVAMGLVFAIATQVNRRTGLFAAVLFISTPLLFMGAATSLIDELSVLGFALAFSSVFFFRAPPIRLGFLQGFVLGLTLWVHSQAVLFPILMIAALVSYSGIANWRVLTKQIFMLIFTAVLFGFYPYLSNYQKLGAIISDTPLVFAMPSLSWIDYFLIGRGVDGITAQIQYGLLKGWFAVEAYGLSFWLVAAAILWLPKLCFSKLLRLIIGDGEQTQKIIFSAFMVFLVYHLGVVLAIILGVNQMFRIERYMLIIMPSVAIFAAFVLSNCFDERGKIKLRRVFAASIKILLVLQLVLLMTQGRGLNSQSENQAVSYMRENLPSDALVFATLSSDMYYSNHKMIGNLDPRLEGFYKAKTVDEAWKYLNKLGISHIFVVASAQPSFYNSFMQEIIADARYSKLLYNADGDQIYALNTHKQTDKLHNSVDLFAKNIKWRRETDLLIGGRKAFATIPLAATEIPTPIISVAKLPLRLFQRDFMTSLQTVEKIAVQENAEYKLKMDFAGYGLLRFIITEYGDNGNEISRYMLTETILSETYPRRELNYRFQTSLNSKYLKLAIEHYGNSRLNINTARLTQ